MREKVFLSSKSIVVRDFMEEDIENKVQWINNPENNQYLHYDLPLNVKETTEWYYNRNSERRRDCVIEYASIPVGLIGLLNIDNVNRKAEFYISMGNTKYKRKGIATIATKLLLKYAFYTLDVNKVYLNVDKENISARKLYERVGFVCEGIFAKDMFHRGKFIDRMRYGLLRENFEVEE